MTLLSTRPAAVALGVTKSFDGRAVLEGLDLTVARGEFVALLGASGSGKTTLLRVLAGLERAHAGEVLVPEARTVVYQEPRLVASQRVWRNVVVGLRRPAGTRERAVEALREVGLEARADAWPGTLSGGEAQRVALARALVREPELLLLDEPFAALDELTRARLDDQLRALWLAKGMTVLFVTHSITEAAYLAERAVVFSPRPARVVAERRIDLPRERSAATRTEAAFVVETHVLFEALERGGA
jgi:sulfonate transport system ATP-binding protein